MGSVRGASLLRNFYPRSPCGERLAHLRELLKLHCISIHALLAESDCQWRRSVKLFRHFYPRSPCGERRAKPLRKYHTADISIHALLAESDSNESGEDTNNSRFLSTLSLRRATNGFAGVLFLIDISIHALLAESDQSSGAGISKQVKFLSTLSLRRATLLSMGAILILKDFYPRSPCGERP